MDASTLLSTAALEPRAQALQAPRPVADAGKASARKAAQEFEAVFLSTFLEGMFSGLKTGAPFGGGQSETVYRSLMLGQYAREISASGGLGIADHVYREILAVQESSRNG